MSDPRQRFADFAGRTVYAAGLDAERASDVREEVIGHLAEAWEARVALGNDPAIAADQVVQEFGPPGQLALRFFLRRVAADLRAAAVSRIVAGVIILDLIGALATVLLDAPVEWLKADGRAQLFGVVFGAGVAVYVGIAVAIRFALRSLRRAFGNSDFGGWRASHFEALAAVGLLGLGLVVWFGLLPSFAMSLVHRAIEPYHLQTSTFLWAIVASCACVLLGYGAAIAQVRAAARGSRTSLPSTSL